jgi:hypothetical protein
MSRDAGIDGPVWINQAIPLAMRRVDVSVTESAIQNLRDGGRRRAPWMCAQVAPAYALRDSRTHPDEIIEALVKGTTN